MVCRRFPTKRSHSKEPVIDINTKFNEVLKIADADRFKRNCIQIVIVSLFSRTVDEHMTGGVVNVSIGKESFGSFCVRDTSITADGGVSMNGARDVINCCLGCKRWTLVRFALCHGEDKIDGLDKAYIDMLGLCLKDRLVSRFRLTRSHLSIVSVKTVVYCQTQLDEPTFVDVTQEKDCTNKSTAVGIIRKLKGPGDVCFYCSPCTGGSSWQRLNFGTSTASWLGEHDRQTNLALGSALAVMGKL